MFWHHVTWAIIRMYVSTNTKNLCLFLLFIQVIIQSNLQGIDQCLVPYPFESAETGVYCPVCSFIVLPAGSTQCFLPWPLGSVQCFSCPLTWINSLFMVLLFYLLESDPGKLLYCRYLPNVYWLACLDVRCILEISLEFLFLIQSYCSGAWQNIHFLI